ncbi:fatty acid oxidation complex subunit alpha FadJ [Glaciecola sp. XM2]|uniref:fatty acid oxidation complex subunit alpha FadJ n=1 Tax=Glaciecola sp. XM2 TaxID=1914931 RepID=UPI001BDE9E69|nr:fatty acid oxidation complex subunit alpha FadJ [Glaciecola sp. XM2]MBT1449919.1 fatty acid oxidation complex subunit alpha FadJ [Glaciecola sp. XM2]
MSAFTLAKQDNGIAILTMDVPGETMNTLKGDFADEISTILDSIEQDSEIKGVVLTSGKKDSFVAGADVTMLAKCESAEEAEALSTAGQQMFNRLENSKKTIVAAIHGPALGGGLELALACHYRVCSDSSKTQLGLPEVQLGLLPGSSGTQRLPALIGVQQAMKMMLTGAPVRAKQAKKYGIVDDMVPESILMQVAIEMASQPIKKRKSTKSFGTKMLEDTAMGRKLLFKKAREQTLSKTKGNYPAPMYIIDCIEAGLSNSAKGYATEARLFGKLVMTKESKQLREIFFATTEMKKENGVDGVAPKKVKKAGVLGGGLMGGGISFVTATKAKVPVRIKDINENGIAGAIKYSYDILNKKVKKRFMLNSQMQKQLSNITGCLDYSGYKHVDIVVEAVFEDLGLKQNMVADIEAHCAPETIFASNTSSIPIGDIAAKAERPENVIGLHYFSPVDKMPLAEVIPHEKTSDEVISTTVEFAKKQGKTPIVVKDGAGFYVNRILAPYMSEAGYLAMEGQAVDAIDRALVNFGFPVGAFKLLDEVGIDVGTKIIPILKAQFGDRFSAPDAFDKLLEEGRKGKKNQSGFYDYKGKEKGKNVDESVYTLLGISPVKKYNDASVVERCVLLMLNEAAKCLEEKVIRSPRDGDIGAIFGIGFPPFLGGPFRYMDELGMEHLVGRLEHYASTYNDKYTPADILLKMQKNNETFYK